MRQRTKTALTLAAMLTTAAGLAVAAAGPAAAKPYPPPSIHLLCTAAANDGTLEGSVCVLPPGVTTAPNSYSATIAVGKAGAAGATVTFALTAGSLPPGLTMAAQSAGSGAAITGNPTKAGTFNFTVKATDGGLTSTMAYQITVTVQGPAGPAAVRPRGQRRLPDQRDLRAARRRNRPALPRAPGHQPPGRRHAQHRLRCPALRPDPARHLRGLRRRSSAAPPPSRASNPRTPSPCRAPATRASRCTRPTRSPWTRTSRWPSSCPPSGSTLGSGDRRPGLRAELLPQRRGRALHLGRCRRAAPARPDPADDGRADRRRQPARRDTDHGRHLQVHHAAHRLRRPAGNPAIQPHHRVLSATKGIRLRPGYFLWADTIGARIPGPRRPS